MNIEAMSVEQMTAELKRIARWMHDMVQTHDQHEEESSPGYCSEFDSLLDSEGGTISRIAARLSGMAAGWQPIETAPKDGQDYIASDGRLRTLENQPQGCMPGRWSKGQNGTWSGYANRPIGYAPKYWHPLPAAPEPSHV